MYNAGMKYFIEVKHCSKVVEVVCVGKITLEYYKSIAEEIADYSNDLKYPVIIDLLGTSISFTTKQLYNAPAGLKGWEPTSFISRASVALIVPKRYLQSWKFVEIVNYGLGRNLKVFTDRCEAELWVLDPTPLWKL